MYLSHKERLEKVLALVKNNQSELARIIGLPSANINAILRGVTPEMSKAMMIGIIKGFNEISAEWLLTGEGEMMKSPYAEKKNLPISVNETDTPYVSRLDAIENRLADVERKLAAWEKGGEGRKG